MARRSTRPGRGVCMRFWRIAAFAHKGILVVAAGVAVAASVTSTASAATSGETVTKAEAQHPAHASTLQQAREWLGQGRGGTAYELLLPLVPQLAGDAGFDVLFGQAALQADEPSQAAFAFERCLALDPANGLCRLGVARAHISLHETQSARDELNILSQASPPAQVQEVIAQYMGLLSGAEKTAQDTRLTSYIQLGLGYDSNINNATSRDRMALPLFNNLEFNLSRDGRKKESGFSLARFNIRYSTPIATHWRFMTEANIAATGNWATHDYDTVVSDINVGVARRANKHQFIAKLQGQNYRLHDRDYRNLAGLLGQYSYAATDRTEVSAFVQGSRLFYPRQRLRNADRYTAGVSLTQGLANDRAVIYATAYGGFEDAVRSDAPRFYDYKFAGLRTGGMYLITPRLQLEAGVGAENRRYHGQDIFFLKSRRDTYYDAYLGMNYAINRKLSLRPQYRYSHSDSNMPLYDHQRHAFTVNLRYELF